MSYSIDDLVGQFKVLADPQRLRVVALCRVGELSVGELAEVLGQSQPRVSQHLKQLCDAGLLDRFRDGKRVYYRQSAKPNALQRRLMSLIASDEALFEPDLQQLRLLRGSHAPVAEPGGIEEQAIAKGLIELTLARPIGDLLDVGCGQGRVLKILASRANRAVGIDIDSESRNIARMELFLAGAENCSLRKGDMHRLDFADASFDTIVLDDVLDAAERPAQVLDEARRVLRPAGRLLVLQKLRGADAGAAAKRLAKLTSDRGLRLARPKALPLGQPEWLLSVLTRSEPDTTIQSGTTAPVAA